MASSLTEIQEALNSHLYAFQSDNVVWPNTGPTYSPSADTPFLAVHNIYFPPVQATLGEGGGENLVSGIYQVDVYVPEGDGWSNLMAKVDALIDHFRRGTTITSGSVTVRIIRAGPEIAIAESGWWRLPVSIYWEAFTDNA